MLTVSDCLAHITQTLGGQVDTNVAAVSIINQAGRYMVSMHDWNWLRRSPAHLSFAAPITFTNGTVGQNEKFCTVPAVSSYLFAAGSKVSLEAVGAITAGDYFTTWQDDSILGLDRIANTGAAVNGTARGTLYFNTCALPDDFRKAISIVPTANLVSGFQWTDRATMMKLRSSGITAGNLMYYGCIGFLPNRGAALGGTVPYLEIYPSPLSASINVLLLDYLGKWDEISDDSSEIGIPDFMEPFFIQVLRAFARGYLEEDVANLDQRLALLVRGPTCKAAKDQDGEVQANLGQMRGGLAQSRHVMGIYFNDTAVGGP